MPVSTDGACFKRRPLVAAAASAPVPAGRSPAVCLDCANFVVEPKHAPYWRERRERNRAVISRASRLTHAALDEAIAQCDRVLSRLEGKPCRRPQRRAGATARHALISPHSTV